MNYSGIITGWDMFSTVSGSAVIDVWKVAYASFPPTVVNTIFGTKPSLSTAVKNTASGLNIAFSAGDVFAFNLDSVTNCTLINLLLKVTKT